MWPLRPAVGTVTPAARMATAVLAALAAQAAQGVQVDRETAGVALMGALGGLLVMLAGALTVATVVETAVGGTAVATAVATVGGMLVGAGLMAVAVARREVGVRRLEGALRGELAAVREQLRLEQAWGDRLLETVERLEASLRAEA